MHARTDQLLSMLDREPVDALVHAHIEQCANCAARLQQLTHTTEQLRALPQFEAPPQLWQQIAAQLPGPGVARPWWQRRASMVALAASVLAVVIAVPFWLERGAESQPAAQQAVLQPAVVPQAVSVQQLVAQSRQLEAALDYLPQRRSVERVGMAATVDTIEQRVQWLDWQLTSLPDSEITTQQTLWSERVTLMDSLVKLRYAESSDVTF